MRSTAAIFLLILFCKISFAQNESKNDGHVGISILFPMVNSFSYNDYFSSDYLNTIRTDHATGILGIGFGVFYDRGRNRYSVNLDLPTSFSGLAQTGGGVSVNALCLEAVVHHRFYKKLNGIFGVNYINYKYDFNSDMPGYSSFTKYDPTLGITTGAEYQFTGTFSIALLYRPAIYSFDAKTYKAIISFEAIFDINIWKK